ncbi:MAG: hybrid sensor histidine kinase/response regulator [Anaerolineae bacterium]
MPELLRTILYIEDDPASRRLVERTLTHAGYNVLLAARGIEGIDMARTTPPDLILTDINLPDISGYEIATYLRSDERFARVPIVALTAQGYGNGQDIAAAAGITGYLAKPLDIGTLLQQLEFYFAGGSDPIDQTRLSNAQAQYTREVVARLEARIRQLEEANAKLKKLDRMKETFIQITAHELRTPLTLIYGYSRLLEDHPALHDMMNFDPGLETLIEGLTDSISRMHSIIEEILITSRIMTNQIDLALAPVNMVTLVQKLVASMEESLNQRHLALHYHADDWPRHINADAEMLRLAMSNLISNAIKFTPDGGEIFLLAQTNDTELHFVVRDTGIGIDASEQKYIFEQFHTTNDADFHSTSKTAFGGGGLGLGLSVCKGIVEAHGGKIWVESPGRDPNRNPGSTFNVILPLYPQKTVRQRRMRA